jgi:hypothetical protein
MERRNLICMTLSSGRHAVYNAAFLSKLRHRSTSGRRFDPGEWFHQTDFLTLETIQVRVVQVLQEDKVEFAGVVDFGGSLVVTISAAIQAGPRL